MTSADFSRQALLRYGIAKTSSSPAPMKHPQIHPFFSYVIPAIMLTRDLNPLDNAHAGRTKVRAYVIVCPYFKHIGKGKHDKLLLRMIYYTCDII